MATFAQHTVEHAGRGRVAGWQHTPQVLRRLVLLKVDDRRAVAACRVGRGLADEEIARFHMPTPLHFDVAQRPCPPVLS